MKTIAITIDETTLRLLDELAVSSPQRKSRSALVRTAIRGFAEQQRRRKTKADEDRILRVNRKRLAREAKALVAEQALP